MKRGYARHYFVAFGLIALFVLAILLFLYKSGLTGFAVSNLNAGGDTSYIDGCIDEGAGLQELTASSLRMGSTGLGFYRGFLDFNTTTIPDTATINSVKLNVTFSNYDGGNPAADAGIANVSIYALTATAASRQGGSEANILSECGGGNGATLLVANSTSYNGLAVNTQVELDLESSAKTILQNNLSQNFFSICIKFDDESINDQKVFNSSESAASPKIIVDYTPAVVDSTAPLVTINSPAASQNFTIGSVTFNITLNENGTANYTLTSGVTNISLSSTDNQHFNATNYSIADGSYTLKIYARDSAGNANNTESIAFRVDMTAPDLTIVSPANGAGYGTDPALDLKVSSTATDIAQWWYILNSGSKTIFTPNTTITAIAGTNALTVYANDTTSHTGSSSIQFSYTAPSSGSSGGGTSNCVVSSWNCGSWSACSVETQTRECTSNCGSKKTETQTCSTAEQNETAPQTNTTTEEKVETPKQNEENTLGKAISSVFKKIPRPSDFIPHGNIPPIVVDTATYTTGTAVIVGGVSWLWLWLLTLFLPFFLVRLRHYSVSIIDFSNKLFRTKEEYSQFLIELRKRTKLIDAGINNKDKIQRFLLEKEGFLEFYFEKPYVINAHFSKAKDMKEFKGLLLSALKATHPHERVYIEKSIMTFAESASLVASWRHYREEKKSEKAIARAFGR